MCLSVYLGTSRPITIPDAAPRELGVEKASWTPPPPRRNHEFVYYLGAKGKSAEPLACSCLFVEHVEWTDAGAIVRPDATYCELAAVEQYVATDLANPEDQRFGKCKKLERSPPIRQAVATSRENPSLTQGEIAERVSAPRTVDA